MYQGTADRIQNRQGGKVTGSEMIHIQNRGSKMQSGQLHGRTDGTGFQLYHIFCPVFTRCAGGILLEYS